MTLKNLSLHLCVFATLRLIFFTSLFQHPSFFLSQKPKLLYNNCLEFNSITMSIAKLLFSVSLLLLLCGCNATLAKRQDYLSAYQAGQLFCAEEILNKTIQNCMPGDKYTCSKDAVMLLLDRATIRFASGDTQGAIHDYQLAIEAIDYYSQGSSSETLGQIVLQDDIGAFAGEDFEQALVRVYFALTLLQAGDENNAFALLRQAEEVQQQKREAYRKDRLTQSFELVDNPVAKYLMATLLEHRGDFSNADILYSQTEKLIGNSLSTLQLRRQSEEKDSATVIIIAHNGNAPYKISTTSDASIASASALEMMLGNCRIPPAYSGMTGIPVPLLMQRIFSFRVPICTRISRQEKTLLPFYNVTAVAAEQLQQKMPLIVARGVARFVLRRGTIACLSKENPTLGSLADLGLFIANSCTQADTRSWDTLPSSIDLTRYDIPPGEHTLHIQICWGIVPPFIEEFPIKLEPHDFCVINIFNIHPDIVSVQIPQHCKNKITKEYSYDSPSFNDSSKSSCDVDASSD